MSQFARFAMNSLEEKFFGNSFGARVVRALTGHLAPNSRVAKAQAAQLSECLLYF